MNAYLLSLFRDMPVLETERLLLRRIRVSDYRDVYDYSKREETSKYLLWSPHENAHYTKRYLAYLQTQYDSESFYDFAVVLKETDKMIGTVGFTSFDMDNNAAEVGYVLHPDYWGRGIAAEALTKLTEFGFTTLSLHKLIARIMEGNEASEKVAKKCGFGKEGISKDAVYCKNAYHTVLDYALLYGDYLRKNNMYL